MNKFSVTLAAVGLAAAMLSGGTVYAGSKYSNAGAELVIAGGGSPAGGQAVINYAKGAGEWIVDGEVWNLEPQKTYYVTLGKGGAWSWWVVAQFTTDGSGNGSFHEKVAGEHPFNSPGTTRPVANGDTYNIVRIWRVFSMSPLKAAPQYLVANEPFGGVYAPQTHGVLAFRGQQRGK
ncbi:MAG: hypothetical protein ABII00_00210 [Elusimicrobiota bacterium]